jgi:hypothetical protein
MNTKYKLVNNVVVATAITEAPFAGNQTGEDFPQQQWPPSEVRTPFPFVQPQVGAASMPIAALDDQVMPATTEGSVYFNTTDQSLKVWTTDFWGNRGWSAVSSAALRAPMDLDTILSVGTYSLIGSPFTNIPPGALDNDSILEIFIAGGQVLQRYINIYEPNNIYLRSFTDAVIPAGSWTSWYQFAGTQI